MKLKKKIALWAIGAGMPLLFFMFILFIVALTPVLIMGGESMFNDPAKGYDTYYGAENGGAQMKLTGSGIFGSPLGGTSLVITSGFGMRMHPIEKKPKMHEGVDISCTQGTPIYSIGDGIVGLAEYVGSFGNLVIVQHPGGYESYYAHLTEIMVQKGDKTVKGQTLIGLSGGTPGTPGAGSSTGPHLHFEIRKNGTAVNPAESLGIVPDVPDILPEELKFVEVDQEKLRNYLNHRNSLLADEPYFSTITNTARRYGVSVLLMFAITGQEQSFVPRSDKDALKIANNPYNVYGAWYKYNTDISDSAAIAAGTIINLSKDRPSTINPIAWINTRGGKGGYAEDKNWWIGVSKIFAELKREAGDVE